MTTPVLQALHSVHSILGTGFLQQIYRRATKIELLHVGLAVEYIKTLPIRFENQFIGQREIRLFQIEGKLLMATVTATEIKDTQLSSLRWAMKELGCELGLVANFYPTTVDVRFVRIK